MEGDDRNGNLASSSCPEPPRTVPCGTQETRPTVQELTPRSIPDMALTGNPSNPQLGQMQHLEVSLRSREELIREQSCTQQIDQELAATPGLLRALQKAIKGKGILGCGFEDKISSSEAMGALRGDEHLLFQAGEGLGGGISLREMLRPGHQKMMSKAECLELFQRIVELVDFAHSQDVVLLDLRPSCFYLHPSNEVRYVGSSAKTHFSAYSPLSQTDYRSEAAPSIGSLDPNSSVLQFEQRWYACPKQFGGVDCSPASNIYSLGVLLFELLCCFETLESQCAWMSSLRDRILPPKFLAENPTETGFCIWLLHPDITSRPTTREILQSEVLPKSHKPQSRDVRSTSAEENKAESELLLHFLVSLRAEKMKQVAKLVDDIGIIEEDLKEIHRRFQSKSGTAPIRNLSQLEEAFFAASSHRPLLQKETDELNSRDDTSACQVGAFFDGLYKFARYSKIEERGSLRSGDLLGSKKVIRSVDFSRDEDYIATADISKKIKIYGVAAILDGAIDVHYPVVEMSNDSKLSCICWNRYIRNYIASTDYDGIVQIWDTNTAQGLWRYGEHQKRAWAVDFCLADPAKFVSSSDDSSVKLWCINERNSVSTIWNPASVCCVQFSPNSADLLAFGCADNKIYCYDMRQTRVPQKTLVGHGKTVSYVKFLDSESIISASTDNTLKLWDLKQTSSEVLSGDACALTFRGHTNEKNFVGLSAWDGYIACGSETNEVFTYYKSMPTPIASLGFRSSDTVAGSDDGNEDGQFVSSVCWGQKQGMLVTANSAGNLKILQLV